MLAAKGQENTAQITDRDSTLSSNTLLFFDCSETSPVTDITDAVSGTTLSNGNGAVIGDGGTDGVNVNLQSWINIAAFQINLDNITTGATTTFRDSGSSNYTKQRIFEILQVGDGLIVDPVYDDIPVTTPGAGGDINAVTHTITAIDTVNRTITTDYDSTGFVLGDPAGLGCHFKFAASGMSANWGQMGTNDYIILICAKASQGFFAGETYNIGAISLYVGGGDTQVKAQPYYAVFTDTTSGPPNTLTYLQAATPYKAANQHRTAGEVYMYAVVRRGNYMEHYDDSGLTGSVDVTNYKDGQLASGWATQNYDDFIITGHSAYGAPYICDQTYIDLGTCEVSGETIIGTWYATDGDSQSVCDHPEDTYGILQHIFPNGCPSQAEIERGMAWMKSRWQTGAKVIYPGWMF